MSAAEKAKQIRALLDHPDHADQAVAILESVEDGEVKRLVARSLRAHVTTGERWRGSTAKVRALIACRHALSEIKRDLESVQLTPAQLGLRDLAAVLQFAQELVVNRDTRDDELEDRVELPRLPRAREVVLGGVHVDLASLVHSPGLSSLVLLGCRLHDAELRLHPRASLRTLRLHDAPRVSSLAVLQAHGELEHLGISGAPLQDLTPLRSLARLRILDLRSCTVPSLEPLRELRELRVIALAGTGLTPADVPATIRPYATWTPEPPLSRLATRPVHPDVAS